MDMADSKTVSPAQLSVTLSKRYGRRITAKAIRSFVRDNWTAYQDDRYTAHLYSPAQVETLTKAFGARGERSKAQTTKAATVAKVKAERRAVHKVGPAVTPSTVAKA
jgi:hypothetical protein